MVSKLINLMGFPIVIAALFEIATKETYTVGDDLGWTIPPDGAATYSNWAGQKSFKVGDTIVFNWTGTHNVAEVSKADYVKCIKTNPIDEIIEISPANFTLDSNVTRYFICTVDSDCERGQKVTISIGEYSSASSLTVSVKSAILSACLVFLYLSSQKF